MAGRSLHMVKIEEITRLLSLGLSVRAIARALKCSRKTIHKYIQQSLAPPSVLAIGEKQDEGWPASLNWDDLHAQFKLGVPLQILWEELFESSKIPIQYPGFWKQFTKRFPELPKTMVRHFAPGERVEIDYCDGIDVLDPGTGEILKTQLFVGVLCYSRYVFAEFSWSQKSEDFLRSHANMFSAFGGVPHTVAPDNLKSAVTKTHRYDPDINPAYCRLAQHYNIAVTPARVAHPKDKAIVERTIQIFQKWFYFRVRKRTFTSIIELNQMLKDHIKIFHEKNHRIFRKTRNELFKKEKEYLLPLPEETYSVSTHKKAKLHHDCHLQFEYNFYSAPWTLRGKVLDVWTTHNILEIYNGTERVALHSRLRGKGGGFITDKRHYPPEHQAYLEITPSFLRKKAKRIGENTAMVLERLFRDTHPLRHLRRAQGIVALATKYSEIELERASETALVFEKLTVPLLEKLIKGQKIKKANQLPLFRGENPHLRGEELFKTEIST